MSEKKILPKEAVSDEKLSNVSGGGDEPGYGSLICPYCGLDFLGDLSGYINHKMDCRRKAPMPDPDDPKPYTPG